MNKEQKIKTNAHIVMKKLLIFFMILLVIYIGLKMVWYFGYLIKFDTAAKGLEATKTNDSKQWYGTIDNYEITVWKPDGMEVSGGIVLAERLQFDPTQPLYNESGEMVVDEDGIVQCETGPLAVSLCVLPRPFSDCFYQLRFQGGADGIDCEFYVDEDLNVLDADVYNEDTVENFQNLIKEKEAVIKELFDIATERIPEL